MVFQKHQKLHITQSALSQQLQNIEKELNCELLKRSNKGVELTQEGEIIFSYAETIIELYNNMLSDIDKIKNDSLKEIKISSCSSVSEYLLPCTIHVYKNPIRMLDFLLRQRKQSRL
ncbi:LysR family transcriptional regulator [Caloramator sp. Dgby_cultured_2]|uniref:LysR family transcriptional regulator n=1 Tax=Caloramator sp. Dgby_cultured_2 TaxID=3029174 RepID=UPI00406CDA14